VKTTITINKKRNYRKNKLYTGYIYTHIHTHTSIIIQTVSTREHSKNYAFM